jgi:hypothetical protein
MVICNTTSGCHDSKWRRPKQQKEVLLLSIHVSPPKTRFTCVTPIQDFQASLRGVFKLTGGLANFLMDTPQERNFSIKLENKKTSE